MDQVRQLGQYILKIAALALGLEEHWFAPRFTRESSYLLANYYPPQLTAPECGSSRLHAHTDYGGFTILYQDTAEGRTRGREPYRFVAASARHARHLHHQPG